MSTQLLLLALVPVAVILIYIYLRDKYNREPLHLLLYCFLGGAVSVVPILLFGNLLTQMFSFSNESEPVWFVAFIVAGFNEELFKWFVIMLFAWRSRHFDERFDGIVYATFVSLGFAAVENVLYVSEHGASVGWLRAFTALPAHAMFGITMGFYLGKAKFEIKKRRTTLLLLSLFWPMVLHGLYDFFLMAGKAVYLLLFVPLFIWMIIRAKNEMKNLSENSRFRTN